MREPHRNAHPTATATGTDQEIDDNDGRSDHDDLTARDDDRFADYHSDVNGGDYDIDCHDANDHRSNVDNAQPGVDWRPRHQRVDDDRDSSVVEPLPTIDNSIKTRRDDRDIAIPRRASVSVANGGCPGAFATV
jgi:hypothetical protein